MRKRPATKWFSDEAIQIISRLLRGTIWRSQRLSTAIRLIGARVVAYIWEREREKSARIFASSKYETTHFVWFMFLAKKISLTLSRQLLRHGSYFSLICGIEYYYEIGISRSSFTIWIGCNTFATIGSVAYIRRWLMLRVSYQPNSMEMRLKHTRWMVTIKIPR